MATVTAETVLAALRAVKDPDRGADVVSLGMVSGLVIKDGHVGFAIETEPARAERLEPLRKAAEKAVWEISGVLSVSAVLTAQRAAAPGARGAHDTHAARGAHDTHAALLLPEVGAIVAVASGKGGVGKSTTAANLAIALAQAGHRTGMLDADIYGPSLPIMMGIKGPPETINGKTLLPMESFGVKCMSIGFLVEGDTPIVWRGPMVMQALEQLMRDVDWGPLDVLVVDMPPGTGDTQLTMAQRVPLAGVVIVSTPQDLALIDARKGLNMFRKVDVPVLGIIENMSYFLCPHCHERTDIFAHGGARQAAERMGVEFLGEIPLDPVIRETTDAGAPIVAAQPTSALARCYRDVADRIWAKLEAGRAASPAAPRIVVN